MMYKKLFSVLLALGPVFFCTTSCESTPDPNRNDPIVWSPTLQAELTERGVEISWQGDNLTYAATNYTTYKLNISKIYAYQMEGAKAKPIDSFVTTSAPAHYIKIGFQQNNSPYPRTIAITLQAGKAETTLHFYQQGKP